jgi:stearoyl-CoA desaturase (delta-9 desaturase)
MDWFRVWPFLAVHAVCFAVIWVGWSWPAVITAVALYWVRMFSVTAFYHRYFSHRTFDTSRAAQFIFALFGASCVQKGPLWWASKHRHHHRHSDEPEDVHSPIQHGLWWSHMGWICAKRHYATELKSVPDLAKYPELRFLDRYDWFIPLLLAIAMYAFGAVLAAVRPAWGTNGLQMLIWGFFISTVVLFHATSTINSLAHLIGRKRFRTSDESRNSLLLALLTMGEGWHNNHHRYPGSTRQGFYWWEIDPTYYGLVMLSWLRIVRNLRRVPDHVLAEPLSAKVATPTPSEPELAPAPMGAVTDPG